tara:strand:+ start:187 stop:513 length:327 start_codon:yes stop_codon:yes gene_type:complete
MVEEMAELDVELVEMVDQAEVVVHVDPIQEKELTQIVEEMVTHLLQVLLKETMVVIHLQLFIKLVVAVVVLVALEQMALKQEVVVLVVLVVTDLIFHLHLELVLEFVV